MENKYFFRVPANFTRMFSQIGDLGSGAGKGGGGGGSIREAGGEFGKREAAQEEEYFYKQVREIFRKYQKYIYSYYINNYFYIVHCLFILFFWVLIL